MSLLKEIFQRTSSYKATLIDSVPTSFFKDSTILVVKVDKKERQKETLNLLLIAPRVKRRATYQLIVMRSVEVSIQVNEFIYGKKIHFENKNYVLPMEIYKRKGKTMDLTLTDVDQMRIPHDCVIESGVYMCRNLITISTREKFCIAALIQKKKELIARYCDIRTEKLDSHVTISHSLGSTGSLIGCRHNVKLYGLDYNQPKLFRKDELTKMKSNMGIK